MVVGEKVDGEGEERKEIEARLHFAGIARCRLAWLDIMSAARDTRRFDQPPSSQSALRALVPSCCSHCSPSHNGIRSLSDAPELWTLCGFGCEVQCHSHLFLIFAAVCCEGIYTTGRPGAGEHAPGATASYVDDFRNLLRVQLD
jgi:hypothetical protein